MDALDALGCAAAGVAIDGVIRVANRSFATLLKVSGPAEIEGRSVTSTRIGELHAGLREDLRLVAMHGKLVRRHLLVSQNGGDSKVLLRLMMRPAHGRCGACVLTIRAVPYPSRQ